MRLAIDPIVELSGVRARMREQDNKRGALRRAMLEKPLFKTGPTFGVASINPRKPPSGVVFPELR